MLCGDFGHIDSQGRSCAAPLAPGERLCYAHRQLAKEQARAATLVTLPLETPTPRWSTPDDVVEYGQLAAGQVVRGELARELSAEARGWATLAMERFKLQETSRLTNALLALEQARARWRRHGG